MNMDFNSTLDRLTQAPGAVQPNNYDNWNKTVGSAPLQQFQLAVNDAITQVDPQQYQSHVQPGVGGTDPLGALAPGQRSSVAQTLISMLMRRGVDPTTITQSAGVPNLDPRRLSPQDLASLLQWTQQNHPQALGEVATQYQSQPDILSS